MDSSTMDLPQSSIQNSNSNMEYYESYQILNLDASPSSSAYAMSPDSGIAMSPDASAQRPMTSAPCLVVEEQPETSYRFRYERESKKPHGPLKGRSYNDKSQKHSSGPTVRLENFIGEGIIRCWLHCDNEKDGPSPHQLVKCEKNKMMYEPFDIPVNASNNFTATFVKMNILHVVKKEVDYQIRYLKKEARLGRTGSRIFHPDCTDIKVKLTDGVQKDLKARWNKIDKDKCTLRFEAYQKIGDEYHFVCSMLSDVIKNAKSPRTSDLQIVKSSHVEGSCTGGTEILIFTERLIKEVKIIFFDDNGWEADAIFKESNIHKQVAVAFKTPPYLNTNITEPVTVYYHIYRKTDGAISNSVEFRFLPQDNVYLLDFVPKRKKPAAYVKEDRMLSESSGMMENDDSMNELLENDSFFPTFADECEDNLSGIDSGDLIQDAIPLAMYGFTKDSPTEHSKGARRGAFERESLVEKARRFQISIVQNDESTFTKLLHTPYIVNFKYNNQTPLHYAVKCQRSKMVSKLLEANASVYELDNKNSNTAVHLAITSPSHTCLELLLQYADDCRAVFNKDGDDPVLHATRNACKNALELLLVRGFPPSPDNKKCGDTPLRVAVDNCISNDDNMDIVDLLLQKGASPLECNYAGETPLQAAVAAQHEELVRKLISYLDLDDLHDEVEEEDKLCSKLQLLELAENPKIKSQLENFLKLSDSTPAQEEASTNEPFLALDGNVELSKKVAKRLGCAFLIPFLVNSEKQSQLLLNHLQRTNDSASAVAQLNSALVDE